MDLKNILISVSISSPASKDVFSYLGETEQLEQNSLIFHTTFIVDYFFERNQNLKFTISNQRERIEEISTTLGKIIGSKNQLTEWVFKLNGQENILVVYGVPIKEEVKNSLINFELLTSLQNYGEYFIIVSNTINTQINDRYSQRVYKSAERLGKDIRFSANHLNFNDVCLGDLNKEIIISFYLAHQGVIGKIQLTLDKINNASKDNEEFKIIDENTQNIMGSCKILYTIEKSQRFINYIEQGLQISLFVVVDYTASNGNPNEVDSLHYIFGREPNSYEQAIRACGSIVAYYDYDQMFPLYGFGAILKGTNMTNHCFNCNMSQDPNVEGLEGIINAYRNSFEYVILDGPTYFYPVIRNMIDNVKSILSRSDSSVYFIFLILTDGQIHDMQMTKEAICEAATLPISLIVIGIGDSDFTNLQELDGDVIPVRNNKGEKVERDIVQFVCYNEFKSDPQKLAEEVLFEIPRQVEDYYKKYKNFKSVIK